MAHSAQGIFLPKKFFVTSGCAVSPISPLNAFDAALVKAGIAQCNLVPVSSILPPDAEKVEAVDITPGTVTFCVMARMDGDPGERIGAGIGWGWAEGLEGLRYGFVAEAHGYKDKGSLEREIFQGLQEMARIRGMKLVHHEFKVECLNVPRDRYGCVVAALVFVPWSLEDSLRGPILAWKKVNNLQRSVLEKPNRFNSPRV